MIETKYLILGGGISGLSFAAQKKDQDYLVLEADGKCGGLCQSFYDAGFVWDVAGHFFHFHQEETQRAFLRLMQGREILRVRKCAKVYYAGKYMDAPFQYNIHQLPEQEFLECLTDLYYAQGGEGSASFESFVKEKYGRGIAEKFLIPYNEKLYACKMNDLEKDSMGCFLPKLDFDTLMNVYRGRRQSTYNDEFLYPVGGCNEVISALLSELNGCRVHVNEPAMRIDTKERMVTTSAATYRYEHLINTIPLNRFTSLAGEEDVPLSYNKVLVLNLGFDRESVDADMHWAYFPGDEIFYRVGFYNNIAKKKRLSLYVEIGYQAWEKIEVDSAMQRTLLDLKRVGIIDGHTLVSSCAYVINPGYAHITKAGKAYTDGLMARMEAQSVFMVGRYARWQYSAMDDSMEQAAALALRI